MPRRHRSGRERARTRPPSTSLTGAAPAWARADGFTVQPVTGAVHRTYRCPGCQQEIRPGTPHFVVVADGDVEGRRHWHTQCWRQEVRRRT
ncbi:MAG TPA: hypothetical protein VHI54_08510 [Actinomycetota bacterium]|nr:hypothetical protein [Actinomycetota bacterium]